MYITPYKKNQHEHYIVQWQEAKGLAVCAGDDLPTTGLIAFEEGRPIAIGFLRCMEGGFAVLDSYITNPDIHAYDRHRALNRVTDKLIKIAKHNKVKGVIAFSSDYNTIERAKSFGFQVFPHVFTILNINSVPENKT